MSEVLVHLPADDLRWRSFAEAHAASPLQRPSWLDVLIGAYRLPARIAAITCSDGTLSAALPLVASRLPWRHRWTALPFTDTLGPIALDERSRVALLTRLAEEAGEAPILVRSDVDLPAWTSRQLGTVQIVDVSRGAAGVLQEASSATRRNVKRASRPETGLTARLLEDEQEFLGAFLRLMGGTRHRLGTPMQPRCYWQQIWKLHGDGGAITVGIFLRDELVAAGVFLLGGLHAVYKYGASDPSAWPLRANHLMFAVAFDELAGRGVRTLDFGISDLNNRSLREFKSRWGGAELPAHYSATDPALLPGALELGSVMSRTIKRTPPLVGQSIGALAYRFAA